MRFARTPALLAAMLLPAASWARPPTLEVRAALRRAVVVQPSLTGNHALRKLPGAVERAEPYALVTRWISEAVLPGPDGKPKLMVVPVRGGLALGWARRW